MGRQERESLEARLLCPPLHRFHPAIKRGEDQFDRLWCERQRCEGMLVKQYTVKASLANGSRAGVARSRARTNTERFPKTVLTVRTAPSTT